ncbi:hypothetical protein Tco_1067735 [Tanacetum coccineum]|uniref:Uncharacterized protein n=1 Tax=Tanacetum coccineum TaxID=301880 RepID=A0ABQ5HFU3_9ASTR
MILGYKDLRKPDGKRIIVIPDKDMSYHTTEYRIDNHDIDIMKQRGRAKVEEDDQERARFLGGKISLGRKKLQELNIDDSGNTGDGGKTVGGTIGACGYGIGDSLVVALYACVTFIYGSLWKGEMANEAKRYLDKSSEGLREVFPGETWE